MRRGLERRLGAIEKAKGGPAAALQMWIKALTDEELTAEILVCERGEPSGMLDPHMMSDAELEQCIAELERLMSASTCPGLTEGS